MPARTSKTFVRSSGFFTKSVCSVLNRARRKLGSSFGGFEGGAGVLLDFTFLTVLSLAFFLPLSFLVSRGAASRAIVVSIPEPSRPGARAHPRHMRGVPSGSI